MIAIKLKLTCNVTGRRIQFEHASYSYEEFVINIFRVQNHDVLKKGFN